MRRLLDIGFILFVALGCVGLDFYILKRDSLAPNFGVNDYIAQRQSDLNDLLHPASLSAALPSELEGWSVTRSGADQMLPGNAQSRADQANEIALVKAISQLTKSGPSAGQMVGMTMTKGDTRLRVLAVLLEEKITPEGIEIAAQPAASGALDALMTSADPAAQSAAFDVVDGVAFAELPAATLTGASDMRMMRATLGHAISVNVITTSDDDAAIKEALQAIDFVMLNKLLSSPVAGVEEGRKTDLRDDGPGRGAQGAPAIASAESKLQGLNGAGLLPTTQTMSDVQKALSAGVAASLQAVPEPAGGAGSAPIATAAAAPKKIIPQETAVFIAPPAPLGDTPRQPCVRRAGVLVCPDGE